MRLFIAGATGVYGRNLIPLLLSQGHTVRVLVRRTEQADALAAQGIETVLGDLLSVETQHTLAETLSGCDGVLHLATSIPSNTSAPGAWAANTALRSTGTRAVLDATLEAGASRYIQQSIVMSYVNGGDRLLDESWPRDKTNVVEGMEAMVRDVPTERLSWCILRGGSFVGLDTAQERLIERLKEGSEVVPGDGSHYISPIHVADMAVATLLAIEAAPAGSIYNVNDEPLRYGEYVDRLADMLGVSHPPRDTTKPTPASYRADTGAIRATLGWMPTHGVFPTLV